MNILDKIIAHKKEEIAIRKMMLPENELKDSVHYGRTCLSLKDNLAKENGSGIIAEFKRKSPSKGFIHQHADVVKVTRSYTTHGASGLSILTDHEFFGGNNEDLIAARENNIPILRKEFIVDLYQVEEAKAIGADAILLIAACLSKNAVEEFAGYARQIGLEVLLELHLESELDHICEAVDMVGINNRNLKTFEVDIQRSVRLSRMIPAHKTRIAESGIDNAADIHIFKEAGYKGFLMGEHFMKEEDPGQALDTFIKKINNQ
jgi:indole-3-glycerol phosphate synthase